MMNKIKTFWQTLKKPRSIFVVLFGFLVISCAFSISVSLSTYIDAFSINKNEPSFIDYDDSRFRCYPLSTVGGRDVAIAWNNDYAGAVGDDLVIPMKVYKDKEVYTEGDNIGEYKNEYTVKAVYKSGFRYTTYKTISFETDNSGNGTVEEIQSEAFYSCQRLETFVFPQKCIRGIGSSAFMDCRNLKKVDMSALNKYIKTLEGNARDTYIANNNFDIGDHAFSSCVSLKTFSFPDTLRTIGESAFHNCSAMYSVHLPVHDVLDKIIIERYAFADCKKLRFFYMTKNVSQIDEYAFVRNNLVNNSSDTNLQIYYNGSGDSSIENNVPDDEDPMAQYFYVTGSNHVKTVFNRVYTDTSTTNTVHINFNVEPEQEDEDHPGLYYIVEQEPICYQGTRDDVTTDYVTKNPLYKPAANEKYVTITKFITPTDKESDDYTNVVRNDNNYGKLLIPSQIAGLNVRKIQSQAFYDPDGENDPLISVTFQDPLIQICDDAFRGCNLLEEINFKGTTFKGETITACTTLQEIGHYAFSDSGKADRNNNAFTGTIDIPNCVRFIGNYAFRNFKYATGLRLYNESDGESKLEFIGKGSFQNLGTGVNNTAAYGTIDLLLPKTLRNSSVRNFQEKDAEGITDNSKGIRPCIGERAFSDCYLLKTVKMEEHTNMTSAINKNTAYYKKLKYDDLRTSIGSQCFSNCPYLQWVKTNRTLTRMGNAVFEKCPSLKELFLSNALEEDDNNVSAWGTNQSQSLFFTGNLKDNAVEYRDLVIYVDNIQAPDKSKQTKNIVWNTDPKTYINEYAMSSNVINNHIENGANDFRSNNLIGRPIIPTHYQVNFHSDCTDFNVDTDGVNYYHLNTETIDKTPDYTDSIAFVKFGSQYTITKCYSSGNQVIDMDTLNNKIQSKLSSSLNVKTIGPSAFATLRYGNPSSKIILPDTVEKIEDRAFYVDPYVYTDGDVGLLNTTTPNPNALTTITYKNNSSEMPTSPGVYNYCCLPTSVTTVDRFAFYNNSFDKVILPSSLSFYGNSAFTQRKDGATKIISITGTDGVFTYLSNGKGFYDTDSMTLLYHTDYINGSGNTSNLNLSSISFLAIGARTFANSHYSNIKLPSSLETIYGGAFNNSKSLQSVTFSTNTPSLKYLGALPREKGYYAAAWNGSVTRVQGNYGNILVPGSPVDSNFDVSDYANRFYYNNSTPTKWPHIKPYYYEWYSNFGSFANCTNLQTFDFTKLTQLEKIGYGAFEGCTSLSNMTGGSKTYTYYQWKTGITEINIASNISGGGIDSMASVKNGILDLSGLTNLRTIGRDAFRNCTNVRFVHLPILQDKNKGVISKNDKSNQAYFWLGMDYDEPASWYQHADSGNVKGKDSVFYGTAAADPDSGGAVLVGESARYACTNAVGNKGSKYYNTREKREKDSYVAPDYGFDYWDGVSYNVGRYDANSLPSGTTYYYIRPDHFSDDIYEVDNVKFWTTIGNPEDHNYILFEKYQDAKAYFQNTGYSIKNNGDIVTNTGNTKPNNAIVRLSEGDKLSVTKNGNGLLFIDTTDVYYYTAPVSGEYIVSVNGSDKFSVSQKTIELTYYSQEQGYTQYRKEGLSTKQGDVLLFSIDGTPLDSANVQAQQGDNNVEEKNGDTVVKWSNTGDIYVKDYGDHYEVWYGSPASNTYTSMKNGSAYGTPQSPTGTNKAEIVLSDLSIGDTITFYRNEDPLSIGSDSSGVYEYVVERPGTYNAYITENYWVSIVAPAKSAENITATVNDFDIELTNIKDGGTNVAEYSVSLNAGDVIAFNEGYDVLKFPAHENSTIVNESNTYTAPISGTYMFYVNSSFDVYVTAPFASKTVTLYVTNSLEWDSFNLYAWKDGANPEVKNGEWPGVAMTYAYTNDQSQDVYKIDFDFETYDRLIINKTSNGQSVTIVASDLFMNGLYLDNAVDGEWHNKVGQWTYVE